MKIESLAVAILSCAPAAFAADIQDPEAFVREVYRRIAAAENSRKGYIPPSNMYTPHLKALFDEDKRRANGEVGCIEFDFWINGQDSVLKDVRVSSKPVAADRTLVIAKFMNETPQEIHFDFQKIDGKWLLDDVQSLMGEKWKLSKLLHCW